MGKKNAGADEAKRARQDEEKRQARIREGTKRINSIFDGATTGSGAIGTDSAYDPTATYYNADGTAWVPTAQKTVKTGSGGTWTKHGYQPDPSSQGYWAEDPNTGEQKYFGGTSTSKLVGKTAAEQYADMVKSGKLFSGTTKAAGFDDDFYNARKQSFIDYATPQLEDQYGDAQKELTYALARGGNLNSSARGEKLGDLQKLYDLNKQQVADQALSYETQARTAVEDARANLITTLNATGDAEGAASAALARSTALSQPAAYSPLSKLFADFTNTLGVQAAQERAQAASGGTYKSPYNTGLFGNTGRVVNR